MVWCVCVGCGVLLLFKGSIKGSRSRAVYGAQTTNELKLTPCYFLAGATVLISLAAWALCIGLSLEGLRIVGFYKSMGKTTG